MGQGRGSSKTLPGDPPVDLVLRRSARARRITLRVSSLDGRVTLSLPRGVSERAALDFAAEKEPWIREHLARRVPAQVAALGVRLPVLGRVREITAGEGPPRLADAVLRVNANRPAGPQVLAVVKDAARGALLESSERHAAAIGREIGRITLRDTRSRWGSCSSAGNLSYSWRLALAPPRVLDYVVAHEVGHLRHMDHSPNFWRVVEGLCPDWRTDRQWLRDNGASLHAWYFG